MVFNDEEINAVKGVISNHNELYRCCPSYQIKEEDIFVKDENQMMKNVFELVRNDHLYINPTYKNKFLCKLANKLFDRGLITAYDCQLYKWMYNPYPGWGWLL